MPRHTTVLAFGLAVLSHAGLAHGQLQFSTSTTGMSNSSVNGVFGCGEMVYAATNGGGVCISSDAGVTWACSGLEQGLPSPDVNGVFALGGTVYAATNSGLAILDEGATEWTRALEGQQVWGVYVVGETIYVAESDGVRISTDDGQSFAFYSNITSGLGGNQNYPKAIHAGAGIVAVATKGGVGVSTNGGSQYTLYNQENNGLAGDHVFGVYVYGGTIYAATLAGLSLSDDLGVSWTNFTQKDGLQGNAVTGVFVKDGVIYASTTATTEEPLGGGICISNDGGATWSNSTHPADGLPSSGLNGVAHSQGWTYAASTAGVGVASESGCPADLTGDLMVDASDLANLLSQWGGDCKADPTVCEYDLDCSGTIDAGDISALFAVWGACGG